RHRTLATYDRDLDAAALEASSYAFYATEAVNLPVTRVSRATNNQAFVMTGAQEAVTYTVKKPKTPRPITFTGSTATEPKVLSATAVSKTQILVTFSEPMGTGAYQPSSYQISVQGSTAVLAVNGAAQFGSTQTQVLLTTAPQEAVRYVLTVGDIQSASGIYMDPTGTTMQLGGSTVLPGPMLLGATSDGNTKVVLSFDTALDPASATNLANYTGTPNLFIQSATLQADNRQVVLVTSPQYQVDYSLVVKVNGADGNPVNPAYNSASFRGNLAINNDRPKVTSAASTGNKSVLVQFSKPMADSTADPSRFAIVQTVTHPEVGALTVTGAEFVGTDRLSVRLTTLSQAEVTYQVTANNVTDLMGNPLADKTNVAGVLVDPASYTFPGTPPTECPGNPPPGTVAKNGATLTGTGTTFRTTFKVGDSVRVDGETNRSISAIASDTTLTVSTAFSHGGSGFTYRISCPDEPVNTDGDALYDHEETRGWLITLYLANGGTQERQVTSSPFNHDTDGDGLTDDVERSLNIDPRDRDTDDDGLTDYSEFNEIFSDPVRQDTDGDALYDGVEVSFFRTSPIENDTDGDQIQDGVEINLGNRNPRVADLPKPTLEVGSTDLSLDVRFVDTIGDQQTTVDSKTASATLSQSTKKEYSNSDSNTIEAGLKIGTKNGAAIEIGSKESSVSLNWERSIERSFSGSFTTNFTETSSKEASEEYQESLTTSAERSKSASQTREIPKASIKASVMLKSTGDIAFNIKNVQLTAHIQDPENPERLTPIATLAPQNEPATGYNLGPFVPPKGPVVFESQTVFPALVQDLLAHPRGVVFRFSNFDVTDEGGRNFAFTSQDVNDRTGRVVIDYGGSDRDGDGQGDYSEIFRVATGTGRRAVDTNGDGTVNGDDRVVVFDANGKHVGITLREALAAAGLKEYNEADNPTSSLPQTEIDKSYSVTEIPNLGERIHRIRRTERGNAKEWALITPTGIDRSLGLDDIIMTSGNSVNLSFVQDLDRDDLWAVDERVNGCSDVNKDTDGDGLDDRFELLIGWTVDLGGQGQTEVTARCSSPDTDNDGINDRAEAPGIVTKDPDGLVLFDPASKPTRRPAQTFNVASSSQMTGLTTAQQGDIAVRSDVNAPNLFVLTGDQPSVLTSWVRLSADLSKDDALGNLVRAKLGDPITDPSSADTDRDNLDDKYEAVPRSVKLYDGTFTDPRITSAEMDDTDGDTAPDGFEERVGGDPTVTDLGRFTDSDGDGLTNLEEDLGWEITIEDVSLLPAMCNSVCNQGVQSSPTLVTSNPNIADTDADGLKDGDERDTRSNPRDTDKDTDDDGLTDVQEVKGFTHPAYGALTTNPSDADTDDDKRLDGEELKQPIIVRVVTESPRSVLSSPAKADADFDRLVDGEEATPGMKWRGRWVLGAQYFMDDVVSHKGTSYVAVAPNADSQPPSANWALLSTRGGTDPTKDNTDGDNRSDYDELNLKRNPLLPDMRVTMNFSRLYVAVDGDGGTQDGDFEFRFYAVDAKNNKRLVVHSDRAAVDEDEYREMNGQSFNGPSTKTVPPLDIPPCGPGIWPCWENFNNGGHKTVRMTDGTTLPFKWTGSAHTGTVDLGSVSTTDKVPEQIGVFGFLQEKDGDSHEIVDCQLWLPDPFVTAQDGTGVVKGTALEPGTNSIAMHRKMKCSYGNHDELDVTLMVSYTAM
ncbi:MAG: hypothetical protein M3179_12775, partial [Actinomycetota bacterium]|nr:hypothetical protein [Actinomycetota bacterium]